MIVFTCWDESGERVGIWAGSRTEAAWGYIDSGDYGEELHTRWVKVYVYGMGGLTTHKIQLSATAPPCIDGQDHRWETPLSIVGGCEENPGLFGHAGGVRIHEVCTRCGCGMLTDTWASDPSDGEEGLTGVRYTPGQYADQLDNENR